MSRSRLLIVDDDRTFRMSTAALLRQDGHDVAEATDGQEAVQALEQESLELILLDLRMPDLNGVEVLRQLRAKLFDRPVVILTTSEDDRDVADSLRAGASGYLLKNMDPDELVAVLNDIVKGQTVVDPSLATLLADLVKQGTADAEQPATPFEKLTARELEILCHLAEGQSNKVIARHLDISDGTVKLHVKAILRKLDVHSRVEAAVMAVEHGIRYRPDTAGERS